MIVRPSIICIIASVVQRPGSVGIVVLRNLRPFEIVRPGPVGGVASVVPRPRSVGVVRVVIIVLESGIFHFINFRLGCEQVSS